MNIEELIKEFAIESSRFHLETFGRQWGGQITIDHVPEEQQEHLEQCKAVLRHYGMLEEGLYKGNCRIVPEGTAKYAVEGQDGSKIEVDLSKSNDDQSPEIVEENPWRENTGKQPVPDDIYVEVMFPNDDHVYRECLASLWRPEWVRKKGDMHRIEYWRYAK